MNIVDRGSGPPLVLIPGLEGRWEYQHATVDALAETFRVITFSLRGSGLDSYARQVADVMTQVGIDRAVVCGISFGGLVALRFAARWPSRCDMLVLKSTPPPALRLRRRHEVYLKAPWLLGPLFLVETPFRVRRELRAAMSNAKARLSFSLDALRTGLSAPVSLRAMAERARLTTSDAAARDCARVTAPTLIITGEPHLDRVVQVEGSAEYERLIPHARRVTLRDTGHLGSMTRPREFAEIIRTFTNDVRRVA